jgi:hypothetical protein
MTVPTPRDVAGRLRPRPCKKVYYADGGKRCPDSAEPGQDLCARHAEDAIVDAPAAAAVELPGFDH